MSETSLIDAVKEGDRERLEMQLDEGADVNQQDEQGWTPLCWAAGRGDDATVRLLLDRGGDVTATGRDQRTPLMIAKAAGHREVGEILTEAEKEKGVWEDPRETRPYCKAYYLREMAAFDDWPEDVEAGEADGGDDEGPSEPILYLHQDFTVTRSMWHGEDVVFDQVTPEWKAFCQDELEFAIPEDLL